MRLQRLTLCGRVRHDFISWFDLGLRRSLDPCETKDTPQVCSHSSHTYAFSNWIVLRGVELSNFNLIRRGSSTSLTIGVAESGFCRIVCKHSKSYLHEWQSVTSLPIQAVELASYYIT